MPITAQCAACKKQYRLVDEMAGKKVKCKQCGQTFDVARSAGAPVGAPMNAASAIAGAKAPPKPAIPTTMAATRSIAPPRAPSVKPVVKSITAPTKPVSRPARAQPAARPQPEPNADPFAAMAELEAGGIPLQDEAPALAPPPLPPPRASTARVTDATGPRRGTVIGYARPMRGASDAAAIAESPAMRYLR